MTDENIRLDRWLWAARFYKTRTIAKDAVDGGKVKVNGQKAKPGKRPSIGDTLEVRQGWDVKTVVIDGLSDKRQGAKEAEALYHETAESQEHRKQAAEQRKAGLAGMIPAKRPDKKQRRDLKKFREKQEG